VTSTGGRLAGRRALVTGGGGGIGRAIAVACAADGAAVAVLDRDASAAASVAREIEAAGGRAVAVGADVTDRAALRTAVNDVAATFGGIDALATCAGTTAHGTTTEIDEDAWERVLAVNLTGTFRTCRYVLPLMIAAGTGAIVTIGSVFAVKGGSLSCAYNASKGGVLLLTRNLAVDYAAFGIRVNCIVPGHIATNLTRAALADPGTAARVRARTPLGRLGRPDEIGAAAVFLLSHDAGFITGAHLAVDGGDLAA